MTQDELIKAVAAAAGQSKDVTDRVIKALGEVTRSAVANSDAVTLQGVAKFSRKAQDAKVMRNPRNGDPINVPAKGVVKVTVLKAFKEAVL